MELFQDITVKDISELYTVNFAKDRIVEMQDRAAFGLSFCVSGQLTYTMGSRQIQSDPGHAILLPQGGSYRIHGDKEGVFPVINFHCTGLDCDGIQSFSLANPQSCLRDVEALRNLLRLGGSRMQIFSTFYGLLDKLSDGRHSADPLVPVIRCIEEHLADPSLDNQFLSQHAHISETYLRKLFQRHYRTTPKQYILELRLQKARLLLADTTLSVTEVAYKSGFSSVYHFCKAFKARTGITPTGYAESHRHRNI